MQGDTTQPTRISKEEYTKFKQWVQDVHGTTRGHLATEIENALREYRQPDNNQDKLSRIEDELATLREAVTTPHADGGSVIDTPESDYTHAHADSTTKPNPNAPRSEKVAWIISEYYDRNGGSTTPDAIANQIEDEFGFGERTVGEYQQLVIDELDAKRHPQNSEVYVWGDSLERVKDEIRDSEERDAKEEMERVA